MRGLFSGHRASAPPGPPAGSAAHETVREETLQAVRQRQREKQRQAVMQMLRAEEERDTAAQQQRGEAASQAEQTRLTMSERADVLAHQIMLMERIMEESGLALDLDEEARADRDALLRSREAYEQHAAEADCALREHEQHTAYISTLTAPFMAPSDVLDEDDAMRDFDECAKQSGRA
ncbi:unnamed protein product [Agarophyton chilense]